MRELTSIVLLLAASTACSIELDEKPARLGEWGYRPANESTATLNPPGFTWRPTDGAAQYELQISEGANFEAVVYETETEWSSHGPSTTLPEKTLYWRYRAIDRNGDPTAWSTTRHFSIPTNAIPYPKPTVAELNQRLPTNRPRLFMRPDDLPRFRELAKEALNKQWKGIQAEADKLVRNPPDTTEPPLYPEGMERKSEEWWGNRRRTIAVANGAATLAFAYRITGDETYGNAARDLLVALTEWDPDGSTNYRYNDEAAMPVLYMASRAYDWAYPLLSDEDRQRVIAMQRARGEDCFNHLRGRDHLWHPYSSHSNRAWHWLAELATTFLGDIPEAERWLDYAMTVYFTCYPVWSDSDGGWHEGVAYWYSYVGRFTQWAFIMDRAYNINAFERPYFKRAGYYPMYILPPGTQHAGFSDQAPRMTSDRVSNLVAVLASGAQNSHWKWYADKHNVTFPGNYLGFFAAARSQDIQARPPTDLPTSTLFEGTGVAALNTTLMTADGNTQIFFKSSPMGTISHGYNGQNTFQLNVNGKPLLQNTGRRDVHGSPHHTKWMWRAKSQNVITVNGKGYTSERYNAIGEITHFRTSNSLDVVAGEAGDAYPGLDRWARRVIFIKPNLFIIHDVLDAKEPSTFQYLLHAPGKFETDGKSRGRYTAGHGSVDFQFLQPTQLAITQTDKYDPPPAEWSDFDLGEWHLTAETSQKSEHQQFLTVYRVDDIPFDGGLERSEDHLILTGTVDGEVLNVDLRPSSFTVTLAGATWSFDDATP